MKGQELIPLEDWVLERTQENELESSVSDYLNEEEYTFQMSKRLAKLLKSTPKLGDFIPCDEDGKPLDKDLFFPANMECSKMAAEHQKAYQEAEQIVFWEGEWKVIDEGGKYYIIHGEDYLVWDKSDRTFDVKVDMIFFRGKDKWTYADLINDEGLENKGLIFKRDL